MPVGVAILHLHELGEDGAVREQLHLLGKIRGHTLSPGQDLLAFLGDLFIGVNAGDRFAVNDVIEAEGRRGTAQHCILGFLQLFRRMPPAGLAPNVTPLAW